MATRHNPQPHKRRRLLQKPPKQAIQVAALASPPAAPPQPIQAPTAAARTTTAGRGQERASRIWQAVQQWNEAPDRPAHEKVALSASTLEKHFGLFRPTAKAFMEAHTQEIEAHKEVHGITAPTHNRSVPDQV